MIAYTPKYRRKLLFIKTSYSKSQKYVRRTHENVKPLFIVYNAGHADKQIQGGLCGVKYTTSKAL